MVFIRNQKRIITAAYWAATFSEGAARIMIPLYFASLGVSPFNIGFMAFIFELFGLFTNLVTGVLVNKFGYRKAFLLALILHTVASLGYLTLADDMTTVALLTLTCFLRAARGAGKELIEVTSSAFLKHYNTEKTKGLSAQLLLGGKEGVKGVGLLFGGALLTYLGFVQSFVALGLVTSVFLAMAWFSLSDYRERRRVSIKDFFRCSTRMKYLATTRAFLYSGRDVWLVIALPIYLTEQGMAGLDISVLVASGYILFGLSQIFFGYLLKADDGLRNLLLRSKTVRFRDALFPFHFAAALVPLSFLLIPLSTESLTVMVILYNILAGAATVPHNHLHMKYAKSSRSAIEISFYKTIGLLGKVIAVLSSGALYEAFGLYGCFVASGSSLLIAAALGYRLNHLQVVRVKRKKIKKKLSKLSDKSQPTRPETETNADSEANSVQDAV